MTSPPLARPFGSAQIAAQTPDSRAITRDGCPVDLYRRLPYCGEVKAFSSAVPPGASILELGCGVGRMTRALIDSGFQVTAVDNSEEMLSFAPSNARLILSDIETLRIDRTFDVVLLASCLINVPSETVCSAYLATCRHHLSRAGAFVFERHDPNWLLAARVGYISTVGSIAMHLEGAARTGDVAELTVRYEDATSVWRHHFFAQALDEFAVNRRLAASGLAVVKWLDSRQTWGLAGTADHEPEGEPP